MNRLREDISGFLIGKGFCCRNEQVCGYDVIYVSLSGGRERPVLPLEINAGSLEEASRRSAAAGECIRHLKEMTGSRPIIITEDRWHSRRTMMEARLTAHLERFSQIYARNCEVARIDRKTAADFLEACHSYGDAACRYRYGLFVKRRTGEESSEGSAPEKGSLVAVATFSNARKWDKGGKIIRSFEWTRYASLPGIRLNGGMGKLLNAFIKDIGPDDIMTYADLEWSEGSVYEQLGFIPESFKEPVVFKVDENWRRYALKKDSDNRGEGAGGRFFCNFGSGKYRMKLTDY